MPTKPITKRQRYWQDHLNNAAASGCTLVTYARNHALKARDLYLWKRQMIKRQAHQPLNKAYPKTWAQRLKRTFAIQIEKGKNPAKERWLLLILVEINIAAHQGLGTLGIDCQCPLSQFWVVLSFLSIERQ